MVLISSAALNLKLGSNISCSCAKCQLYVAKPTDMQHENACCFATCEPKAFVTWQLDVVVKLLHKKQFSIASLFSAVLANPFHAVFAIVISYSQSQHHNLCMLARGAQQPVYFALNWQKQLELE